MYRGNNGANEVFSFLRTGETTSGSVDITAISRWIQNRGWFGNANLHNIQFGFEITSSAGGLSFTTTDYSVSCSAGGGGTTSGYVRLKNRATGLYLDGMGRSSNGSTAGQWSNSTSYNQQWSQETQGSYVRFRNRATGTWTAWAAPRTAPMPGSGATAAATTSSGKSYRPDQK